MKLQMFDIVTGAHRQELDIPDEVLKAAHTLSLWMDQQPTPPMLLGLVQASRYRAALRLQRAKDEAQ